MSKKSKLLLGSLFAAVVLLAVFTVGFFIGQGQLRYGDYGISKIVDAWDIITENYVTEGDIDLDALAEAAIRGIMEELGDPYSSYLDPDAYKATLENFKGSYEGIGAEVSLNDDGQSVIVQAYEGSPAETAGMLPGDIIVAVDGQSAEGLSLSEVVAMVRGPKDSTVVLSIEREGVAEPLEILVARGEIDQSSVSLEMIGSIAHLSIAHFTEKTSDELDDVVDEMESRGATGIVLDLRHNPGGRLTAVVDVVSHFITDGLILRVIYNNGDEVVYDTVHQSRTTSSPVIVLVDAASASGSEVLAGALQDHGRAEVAGTVTFGKGSVNQLYELPGSSGIYLTIARWYTPDGNLIEGQGITPDYELTLMGDDLLQWALDYLTN